MRIDSIVSLPKQNIPKYHNISHKKSNDSDDEEYVKIPKKKYMREQIIEFTITAGIVLYAIYLWCFKK